MQVLEGLQSQTVVKRLSSNPAAVLQGSRGFGATPPRLDGWVNSSFYPVVSFEGQCQDHFKMCKP